MYFAPQEKMSLKKSVASGGGVFDCEREGEERAPSEADRLLKNRTMTTKNPDFLEGP